MLTIGYIGRTQTKEQGEARMKYTRRIHAAGAAMLACAALTALPAAAQMAEPTMQAFTGCTSRFFQVLAQDAAARQALPAMEQQGELAWIKVKDRKTAPDNLVSFATPVTVGGMKLLAYFDEVSDLEELGRYYYWGFVVDGPVEEVIGKLRPLVQDAQRLRGSGSDYARTEVRIGKSQWLKINTGAGSIPQANSTERAFIVESMEGNKGATRVSCSLQGAVSAELLKTERPDLGPADLPPAPPEPEEIAMPAANVLSTIDAAAPAGSVWRPRFRAIKMIAAYQGARPFKMGIEMKQVDGLLRVREQYTSESFVDRLSFAGLQQLGFRIYLNRRATGKAPYLIEELTMALPAQLEPGETLSFSSKGRDANDRNKPADLFSRTCKIGTTMAASDIHPSLSGQASILECKTSAGFKDRYAFLQDLGVAVLISSGNDQISYPQFEVTR